MKSEKSIGLNAAPCGTPVLILYLRLISEFILTSKFLSAMKLFTNK